MRKLIVLVFVLGAFMLPQPARAAEPQPVQYAMIRCSGLSIDNIVAGEQQFDTAYGWTHNLTTPEQWQASYISRVNGFASALGCPAMLVDDGTPAGALSFAAKIYAGIYRRILQRNIPQ